MTYTEIGFPSGEDECSAWHFRALGENRPVVVMAHGFGGTKDSGLEPFARRFAGAGFDVVAFDYRGFGTSGGVPRQSLSVRRQTEDYHAAIAAAKKLPGVDTNRIALWGASFSGGHVLRVAAERDDIGAVINLEARGGGGRVQFDQHGAAAGSVAHSRSPIRNSAARSRRICGGPSPERAVMGAGAKFMMA